MELKHTTSYSPSVAPTSEEEQRYRRSLLGATRLMRTNAHEVAKSLPLSMIEAMSKAQQQVDDANGMLNMAKRDAREVLQTLFRG